MTHNSSMNQGGRRGEVFRSWRRDVVHLSQREIVEALQEAGAFEHLDLGVKTVEMYISACERGARPASFREPMDFYRGHGPAIWREILRTFAKRNPFSNPVFTYTE